MNNYYFIYLEPERYIAEYILKHFGVSTSPADGDLFTSATKKHVEFSNTSPERKILTRFLDKLPADKEPNLPAENSIAVKLPMVDPKRPRDGYTYLSESAKRHLIDHFVAIIDAHLVKDFLEALRVTPNMNISNFFNAWCELNGIDIDDGKSPESLRQKLYRIRREWKKKNSINLV